MSKYKEFEMYRGLQKPLVVLGLKGPNIIIGGISFLGSFFIFILSYAISGYFLIGLACAVPLIGWGAYRIYKSYKRGLYKKKEYKGIWITKNVIRCTS